MKYFFSVLRHKWFLLVAGLRVGGIPLWRLLIHDWSKFTPVEFIPYRQRFEFGKYSKPKWDKAWLKHLHRNPHHWDHWVLKGEPLEMPETYVREMVADWLAAERSYGNSWEIQPWLDKKVPTMLLHPTTISILAGVLKEQGFKLPKVRVMGGR